MTVWQQTTMQKTISQDYFCKSFLKRYSPLVYQANAPILLTTLTCQGSLPKFCNPRFSVLPNLTSTGENKTKPVPGLEKLCILLKNSILHCKRFFSRGENLNVEMLSSEPASFFGMCLFKSRAVMQYPCN